MKNKIISMNTQATKECSHPGDLARKKQTSAGFMVRIFVNLTSLKYCGGILISVMLKRVKYHF